MSAMSPLESILQKSINNPVEDNEEEEGYVSYDDALTYLSICETHKIGILNFSEEEEVYWLDGGKESLLELDLPETRGFEDYKFVIDHLEYYDSHRYKMYTEQYLNGDAKMTVKFFQMPEFSLVCEKVCGVLFQWLWHKEEEHFGLTIPDEITEEFEQQYITAKTDPEFMDFYYDVYDSMYKMFPAIVAFLSWLDFNALQSNLEEKSICNLWGYEEVECPNIMYKNDSVKLVSQSSVELKYSICVSIGTIKWREKEYNIEEFCSEVGLKCKPEPEPDVPNEFENMEYCAPNEDFEKFVKEMIKRDLNEIFPNETFKLGVTGDVHYLNKKFPNETLKSGDILIIE